jgi:Holliday junction resolvase-like predicted endonuclease
MKSKIGLLRHDSLIDLVEKELRSRGFEDVVRNEFYNLGECGEIDLYAVRGKYVLLFEVKARDSYKSRKKAIEQLTRAERNCFPFHRVFKFYVSDYKEPLIEWVRRK